MSEDYEDVWQLVSSSIDISREEFENLVNKVYEKASNLVTKRAAAIVVARDLGVNTALLMYPPIRGRVLEVSPTKYSSSASGETPYVLFTLVNNDGRYLCVAFGQEHIEKLKQYEDRPVELRGYTRVKLTKYTMIKVTEKSEIIPLDENAVPPLNMLKPAFSESLKNLEDNPGSYLVKAVVIEEQTSEYFTCPICGRNIDLRGEEWVCPEHGVVDPVIRRVYRFLLSDKTGVYPAVYFGEIDRPSILNKLIVFKGFMRGGEIQISKIYEISEEDAISL
ncbi:MAG: hypothetical protein ACP6IP_09700 [Candidatus Njordarchaeia archaeon]